MRPRPLNLDTPRVQVQTAATYGFQLKFLFGAVGTGNTGAPAITVIRLSRPRGLSVSNPATGRELGKLVYSKTQSNAPRDQTVIRLRSAGRTSSGFVLADAPKTRVVMHPDQRAFLSVTVPGARNPRLYLNAYGSRLLRFGPCGTATFAAYVVHDGIINTTASTISSRALRRAQLCK